LTRRFVANLVAPTDRLRPGLRGRFAAIEHDRGEESQIGGGQQAAVAMRIKPRVRSKLYAAVRPCKVETSMLWSQLEPSTVRKSGSSPNVRANRHLRQPRNTF